jgi:tetrahydromethanopterin S-methyltransferase subunit E
MERGWIETVQMLGLDMMVAVTLGVLVTAAIWQLVIALWNALARMARRKRRVLPTSPRDAYATQEWGPAP